MGAQEDFGKHRSRQGSPLRANPRYLIQRLFRSPIFGSRPKEMPDCKILFCDWKKLSPHLSAKLALFCFSPAAISSGVLKLNSSFAFDLKNSSSCPALIT